MEANELMNKVLKSTLFRQKRTLGRSWEFVQQRALSLFRLVSAFRANHKVEHNNPPGASHGTECTTFQQRVISAEKMHVSVVVLMIGWSSA